MRRQVLSLIVPTLVGLGTAHAEAPPSERSDTAYRVRAALVSPKRVEFTVEARGAFHLNDDYPVRVDARASGEARVEKARVDRADGVLTPCAGGGHACRAVLPVTVEAKGQGRVDGTVAVSLCDEERCLIEKITVGVPVGVKQP